MLWNLKKIIIEMIKHNNYNYLIDNVSLEDRVELVENFEKYQDRIETIFTELSNELGIEVETIILTLFSNYFTNNEALEIYNSTENQYLKLYSAINLSDNEKDKHINEPPYDEELKKAMIETYSDLLKKAEYQKRIEVEEYIKDFNDFEKVEYMKNLSADYNKIKVLITIENDELLYKLMGRIKGSELFTDRILENIYDNNIKVKILTDDRFSSHVSNMAILDTLPEPQLIEVLKYFLITKNKSYFSHSFKDYIYNLSNTGKVELFSSDGFKFDKDFSYTNELFFEELTIDDDVAIVLLKLFNEDKVSLEHLMLIDNDKLRYLLLTNAIEKIKKDDVITLFKKIESDEYKILLIPEIKHIIPLVRILRYIKDVDTKIKMLELMDSEELGCNVRELIQDIFDEEGQLKAILNPKIQNILSHYDIFELSKGFNDNGKFKILDNIDSLNEEYKFRIISYMSDEAKIKILENNLYFTKSYNKAAIVGSIRKIESNDLIKLEYLKELIVSGNKDGSNMTFILNEIFLSIHDTSVIYEIISSYLTKENILDKIDFTLKYLYEDEYDSFKYNLIEEIIKNNYYDDLDVKFRVKNIMKNLGNEEYIFKCIKEFHNEITSEVLIELIEKLKDPIYDQFKIDYVKENIKFKRVSGILNTITDSNLVINMFDNIKDLDDEKKIIVLTNLRSGEYDNLKSNFLDNLINNGNIKESLFSLVNSLENNEFKLKYLILSKDFSKLDEFILHNNFIVKYKIINKELIKLYSIKYSVNYAHLLILIEKYGYEFLRTLDNVNIRTIINSNDQDFSKLLMLFDIQETIRVEDKHIDSVLHALLQKDFRLKNKDIFNLFNQIKDNIYNNKIEEAINELDNILVYLNNIDSNFIINLLNKNNIDSYEYFISTLSNENLLEKNLRIINSITNKYILECRNEYANEHYKEFKVSLKLEKTYEKNGLIKAFLRKNNIKNIMSIIINYNKLSVVERELVENRTLLEDCIKFRRGETISSDKDLIIKNIKTFNSIIDKLYIDNLLDKYADNSIKVSYNIECDNRSIIRIMQELNIDVLSKRLFSNKDLYYNLLNYLKNYRMIGWGNTFSSLSEKVDMDLDENTIASFLTNYYIIVEKLEEKQKKDYMLTGELRKITLSQYLEEAEVYASDSFKYKKLLGSEDFRLIRTNPPNNTACMAKEERLKLAVEKVKEMYLRDYITIPPNNETIRLSDGKSLTYTIGATDDMMNLTYGERTGACMRIGGAAKSLFDFCLTDPNGFHVKITNPNTGKLVSRVSGFRNGNTIFLNQLRTSLDLTYSDEDLIYGLRQFFDNIIELSKNSEYPIKNVFISSGFAMEQERDKTMYLGDFNIKEGYNQFYSDIQNFNAIKISSTGEPFEPIQLGPDKSIKYSPLRQTTKLAKTKEDILEIIDRYHIIDELLLGKTLDNIILHGENNDYSNVANLYYGSDWYIALDENNNIIEEFVINRESFKEKQVEEMTVVIENIKKLGGNTYD